MPNTLRNYQCAELANAARNVIMEELNAKRGKPKTYTPPTDFKYSDDVPWRGIYKVQEEMNELGVELMKLSAFPSGTYPDHGGVQRDLLVDVIKECTDVKAALDYFMEINGIPTIYERYRDKREKFALWGLSGIGVVERNA